MKFNRLLTLGGALLMMCAAAPADAAGCCDTQAVTCCKHESQAAMSCCKEEAQGATSCCDQEASIDVVEVLFAMDPNAIRPDLGGTNAVQRAEVWFERPVWVGAIVLMGKHVIEHDTNRQARGEPCTHIYSADDLKTPVAAFHCTHLDRERVEKNTVVLQPLSGGQRRFVEFQFGGEAASHGYPAGR